MPRTVARLLFSCSLLLLPSLPMLADPAQPAGACTTNAQCGEKEFCAKLFNSCDQTGICEERPTDCTEHGRMHIQPVCGCDGKPYDNACLAATAGTSVKSEGKCPA